MTIDNVQEFKQALPELSIVDQRILAAQFVQSVVSLMLILLPLQPKPV